MTEEYTPEEVREVTALNKIITDAVIEVVQVFGSEMTERDTEMVLSVQKDESIAPEARVALLIETLTRTGVSEKYQIFVSQVMETLRQQLTLAERNILKVPDSGAGKVGS